MSKSPSTSSQVFPLIPDYSKSSPANRNHVPKASRKRGSQQSPFRSLFSWRFGLPRLQGYECCDQPWMKGVWREAYLDGLAFLQEIGDVYRNMHRPFAHWARRAGGGPVLDLASGNGGPVETLTRRGLLEKMPMPTIILSDRIPDLHAFERLQQSYPQNIGFHSAPVDALRIKDSLSIPLRLRSICSAFHHFPPDRASAFLEDAVRNSDGLFIMEVFERSFLAILQPLLNLFPLMLSPFFSGRWSFKKLLITTLIPIIPLMIIYDGVVSALRTYRTDEILAMVPQEPGAGWHWETGRQRYLCFFSAPYLFGYRERSGN